MNDPVSRATGRVAVFALAALLSLPANAIPERAWHETIDPDWRLSDAPSAAPSVAPALPSATTPVASLLVIRASVRRNLPDTLESMRLPEDAADDLASAFAHDPIVQGRIPRGSEIEVACDRPSSGTGDPCSLVRSAVIRIRRQEHRIYRYTPDGATPAMVNEHGTGVSLTALAAPLPHSRMSSGWGWRIHPVLRRRRFHHGVDYAAPTGTPVLAAEDGLVEEVGRRGHYGDYIRVRHLDRLQTAYAHLSGYASDVEPGTRVMRGQVIGYVGATGWATGPHLYFEVIVDGARVNPLHNPVALPLQLQGDQLSAFERYRADEDRALSQANGACAGSRSQDACRQVAHR